MNINFINVVGVLFNSGFSICKIAKTLGVDLDNVASCLRMRGGEILGFRPERGVLVVDARRTTPFGQTHEVVNSHTGGILHGPDTLTGCVSYIFTLNDEPSSLSKISSDETTMAV